MMHHALFPQWKSMLLGGTERKWLYCHLYVVAQNDLYGLFLDRKRRSLFVRRRLLATIAVR